MALLDSDLPVQDLVSFTEYDPAEVIETAGVQFVGPQRTLRPARVGASPGSTAYHYVLPGENPVVAESSRFYSKTNLPRANDQTIACTPRSEPVMDSDGNITQKLYREPVLDGEFVGLSSGFYSDLLPVPYEGVHNPYSRSDMEGVHNKSQCIISYFWHRIGDIVNLQGRACLVGLLSDEGRQYNWLEFRLPIPIPENVPPFSGNISYISSPVQDSHLGRDPRLFGQAQMIFATVYPSNDEEVVGPNDLNKPRWPMYVYAKELTRDIAKIHWWPDEQVVDGEIQFSISYSLQPIDPRGIMTPRYCIDRLMSNIPPPFEWES